MGLVAEQSGEALKREPAQRLAGPAADRVLSQTLVVPNNGPVASAGSGILFGPVPDTVTEIRAKRSGRWPDRPRWTVRGMYFSGTGTTAKVVSAVAEAICREGDSTCKEPDIDFTPPRAREHIYRFDETNIVVFGVPVIAGRVPNVLLSFLSTLEGDGALAVPIVLYGNRNFDDALIELRDILEEQGFYTFAAAAFIGEHSFSRVLAAGRPDEKDMEIAEQFGADIAQKIRQIQQDRGRPVYFPDVMEELGPIPVDGEYPYRPYYKPRDRQGNHINILKVKPKLDAAKCTGCGICVDVCPMGSIKASAPGVVNGICIKCCGCEKACPEGALYFDDPGYLYHKEELELGYPERKEPAIFL